jgi:hypothetical protein
MAKKQPKKKIHKSRLINMFVMVGIAFLGIISFIFVLGGDTNCANSISCTRNLSGGFDQSAQSGEYLGHVVQSPAENPDIKNLAVLGDSSSEGKRIEIDLANQKLYAFEFDRKVYEFPVSTGKWGRTPTGTFKIWIKLRYTRMTGGNKALGTYYNLPNVPYTMFFYNKDIPKSRGYGIHGAYWHNNFGHPMSHGCINMREEDVAKIYQWANPETEGNTTYATDENPGTPILIYGTAPQG